MYDQIKISEFWLLKRLKGVIMSIRNEAEQLESYLVQLRRTIHENPELGFKEY